MAQVCPPEPRFLELHRVGFCPEDVETASLPAVEFRVFAAAGERALVAVGEPWRWELPDQV